MVHNRSEDGIAMNLEFPSQAWVERLVRLLNNDARYREIARHWEGDLVFVIKPESDGAVDGGPSHIYLDLWHGTCRSGKYYAPGEPGLPKPAFTMTAVLGHFQRIIGGELDPMQAMMTRRLQVAGNMAYILRNVPVVLDFVRCCRLVAGPG